ncbi:MAG: TIGR04076 family protein [Oscillospiraceae bacterium]|nr:TIGR04076 family protein [Oscillospiraceae bacterium]
MEVKITVMRKADYADLRERYENPIEHTCDLSEGQVFTTRGERPPGLCESAWETLLPFIRVLLDGGGNFYDGWMKNEKSAMLSCNDGFRPVSFLIEAKED